MSEHARRALARFAAEWESLLRGHRREPPSPAHYVPDAAAVRLEVLVELVRADISQRRRRAGLEKRVSAYRTEFPEITGSPDYAELVYEEFLVRGRYGPLDPEVFGADYPEVAGELRERLRAGTPAAAPAELPADIAVGRTLDDFDLLTDLGGQAHSRMFLARQRSMQRLVAVRVDAGADSDTHTVAQLEHDYIVRVFDQRLLTAASGKSLRLLYMQYLPGGNAEGVLRSRRERGAAAGGAVLLDAVDAAMESRGEIRPAGSRVRAEIAAATWPETVAWVGRRLATALDHANREGVLHHDIRPANVLFTAEGVPKLADFALGPRFWNPASAGLDGAPPDQLADLRWRAPEALAAAVDSSAPLPDTRADIYSLGLLLWEMLTGAPPFEDPLPDEAGAPDDRPGAKTPPSPGESVVPGDGYRPGESPAPDDRSGSAAPSGPADAGVSGDRYRPDESTEPGARRLPAVPLAAPDSTAPGYLPGPDAVPVPGTPSQVDDETSESDPRARDTSAARGNHGPDVGFGQRVIAGMLARRRAGVPDAALAGLPADTPYALRRVLLECLDPDPDNRRSSGAELAGQFDLCLDARARDLVDPPRRSWRARARGWAIPIATLCLGLPNLLASVYKIRLSGSLIGQHLTAAEQQTYADTVLVANLIAFPLAGLLLLWLARRPLTVSHRLARGHRFSDAELARARADTLLVGERAVWVAAGAWIASGLGWPTALVLAGVQLPDNALAQIWIGQLVCAAMALAYPFFLITVYSVRSLYPPLLTHGTVGPADRDRMRRLARRSNWYLGVAAAVPLLGVASASLVPSADLGLVIDTVRWLSVGGVLAFAGSYWLSRLLEADLLALIRAIPAERGHTAGAVGRSARSADRS
ncbi:protein kinase domain-containing protein [Nocardia sp. NPDC055321]